MNSAAQWVVFGVDEQRLGLPLPAVDRVVSAVEISPLPQAPPFVSGVIDVQGEKIPVYNLRRRFGWPERELELTDLFLIARTPRRAVALVADTVIGVLDGPVGPVETAERREPGVRRGGDGLIVVDDLDSFLSAGVEQPWEDVMT